MAQPPGRRRRPGDSRGRHTSSGQPVRRPDTDRDGRPPRADRPDREPPADNRRGAAAPPPGHRAAPGGADHRAATGGAGHRTGSAAGTARAGRPESHRAGDPGNPRAGRPEGHRAGRRAAPGRSSERADDHAGSHRTPRRLRSRGAMLAAAAAAAVAVGAPIAAKFTADRPAAHIVGGTSPAALPGSSEPEAPIPDAVDEALRPGAPIRTPSPSPSPSRSATPKPTRAPAKKASEQRTSAPAGLSFEAESSGNTRTGSARLRGVDGASGGVVVSNLGGGNTLALRVPLSAAGTRTVTIHYVAGSTRAAALTVNGRFIGSTSFPDTDGRVGSLSLPFRLVAGTNVIGFANPGGRAPDIDRVVVDN
ncbi:hypothetical protein GCM10010123_07810 [Pilimelia anulata]|uniref:CBM6 domain-containing protein n=1 Tax=Pilimelia anulata TaxID=53371 RepID=A0A8J3B4K4_9ACTN|nr:hypothetical protein [Pilimelia anulata]GGJ80297.1 hypothetical protein GCM10010123_07810 [Pilimelia anulata]